ncbi:hypothetical protein CYLTODRAFT_488285 [Cylindrobasidium torrendii FP15055 ss-10]|uniref:Uncharacterized protein n=1 Tax=Cylindrobasidium torrendii FP15055 ss-10 TaxID=1314674 RepID=A0A0D7BI77_9AGAR|nr:hypothetical protein CYLTODRAFT_488285 [Cylindrobasidium torrendii FP15055 ss-10]
MDAQATTFIPYTGGNDENVEFPDDLENGPQLRWEAYKSAWNKCLGRIQKIVRKLHEPIIATVSRDIHQAYSQRFPGLARPELPVIAISNPTGSSAFLDEILGGGENDKFLVHLHPTKCSNLTNAMRTLVSGFTDKYSKSGGSSLSSYDIKTLDAWYDSVRQERRATKQSLPNLVVILHDFERFDVTVMQDFLYICSLHIPSIPLVFVVSLLSPQSPTYLHVTYPRWVLSVLRIRQHTTPSGPRILDQILLETFFDPSFMPDIMLGPGVLSYVLEHLERYEASVDSLTHLLKLAFMNHYTSETYSFLSSTSNAPFDMTACRPFDDDDSSSFNIQVLNAERNACTSGIHAKRVGCRVLLDIYAVLKLHGFRIHGLTDVRLALSVFEGRAASKADITAMADAIRKLKFADVPLLMDVLLGLNHVDLATVKEIQREMPDDGDSKSLRVAAEKMAEWFLEYTSSITRQLEKSSKLWYLWYTGRAPFPVELVNPSVRSTIVGALLRPTEFTKPIRSLDDEDGDDAIDDPPVTELADTSILFQRYLESGRMVNVYDWYTAFKDVLDVQRDMREEPSLARPGSPSKRINAAAPPGTPSRRNPPGTPSRKNAVPATPSRKEPPASPSKTKGKGKGKEVDVPTIVEESVKPVKSTKKRRDKKAEEKWQLECHARFIRGLHELDYVGFVKHTGRKADHVFRTVFEIGDDEEID